jgi:hypothetical protein
MSAGDACAVEKGCVRGAGLRQLLHFTTVVSNAGDADLLIGAPSAPPFAPAACDGQPYFGNFLRYQLVNLDGELVAEGHMQAQCKAAPNPYVSTFDCQFYGLAEAFSQVFPLQSVGPADRLDVAVAASTLCQWLDITGVAPGSYVLRMQVNPNGLLVEKRTDNNRLDLPIQIPAFDAPAQPCPAQDSYLLLGRYFDRECGWSESSAPATCTPGQSITVACPDCTGDPMLRVCEGASPCLARSALAWGDSSLNQCPEVSFDCPAGGAYSVYATSIDTGSASCRATVQASTLLGTDAGPR